jgi:hypothetical protein
VSGVLVLGAQQSDGERFSLSNNFLSSGAMKHPDRIFSESDLVDDLASSRYLDALRKIDSLYGDGDRSEYSSYLRAHICRSMGALDASTSICRSARLWESPEMTYVEETFLCAFFAEDWTLLNFAFESMLDRNHLPESLSPGCYLGALSKSGLMRALSVRDIVTESESLEALTTKFRRLVFKDWSVLHRANTLQPIQDKDRPKIACLVDTPSTLEHLQALCGQLISANPHVEIRTRHVTRESPDDLVKQLEMFDPDLLLVQHPYLEKLPQEIQSSLLIHKMVCFGYGPRLASNSFFFGSSYGQYGFSGYLQSAVTMIHHPRELDRFRRCGVHAANLALTGDPLTWTMRRFLETKREESTKTQIDLLWAPHWSTSNWTKTRGGYSNVERDIELVLEAAEAGVRIRVRPHPLMMATNGHYRMNLTSNFWEKWDALLKLESVQVSDGTMFRDCLDATRLLTDGVSIIHYWALTGKEIGLSVNPGSPGFSSESHQLIAECHSLPNVGAVAKWLRDSERTIRTSQSLIDSTCEVVADHSLSPGERLMKHLELLQ